MTPTARRLLDKPPAEIAWVTFFISVSALLLNDAFGTWAAAGFIGPWLLLGLCYGRTSFRAMTATPTTWVVTGLAFMSVLWSWVPVQTLRFATEHALTVGCALLAAAMLTPRQLISSLMCGLTLVAVLSLLFGRQLADPMTGSMTFVGLFASKNTLAFFANIVLLTGIAALLDSGQKAPFRILSLFAIAIVVPLLVMTRSATSQIVAVVGACLLLANLIFSRLSHFGRVRFVFAGIVIALPALVLAGLASDLAHDFIVHVMGKDVTLTGRTLLWRRAEELIPAHPFGGVGFQSFWVQGNIEAEGIWRRFHVMGRSGFHFHNTYIETTIELGYLGAAVLCGLLGLIVLRTVRWSWGTGTVAASFFAALLASMLIRSMVEVEILGPFSFGTFLLFVTAYYASLKPREVRS